ncbi:MAG: hypothetical protein HN348_03155 [Proteobacteria bacterium]|jgi:radical SAM enzyme (TIGR01210 family)|nr:hypothetical protein [Pseudomonadota bacterium]
MQLNTPERLEQANATAHKTYEFDDEHNDRRPADWWFQESVEGTVLFIVFYSQACRWSLCTGCNLPSVGSKRHVGWRSLVAQVDWLLSEPDIASKSDEIRKVIVSNNGSVLDEDTFSTVALMYLLAQLMLRFPVLHAVSLETRAEYVDLAELEFLSRAIKEGASPAETEIAIGFEAFDDHIRNKEFLKGLSLEAFEEMVERVAGTHLRLKCYFMQKPVVTMTDEEAVIDVQRGIDYLSEVSLKHKVPINIHLNPTYVASGTPLESAFREGKFWPPRLLDVVRAVVHSKDKPISVFVGLNDEGLAVEGGGVVRPGEDWIADIIETFNRTQDYAPLERLLRA